MAEKKTKGAEKRADKKEKGEDDYSINGYHAKVASSNLNLVGLMKEVSKLNRGDNVIQLFDSGSIINSMHLFGSYLNAREAFRSKSNIANSIAMEMLLFAGMTCQITDAIKKVGAKSNKEFVLFANSKSALEMARRHVNISDDFSPTAAAQKKTAQKHGIKDGGQLNSKVLQKIAISRLEG